MKEEIMQKANELIAMLQFCEDEELISDVIAAVTYAEPFELRGEK